MTRLKRALARLLRREQYVVVTMDDVLPMYGEGRTRDEAVDDLLGSLVSLRAMLEEDPARLGPPLALELDVLRRLMKKADRPDRTIITVTNGPTQFVNTSNLP